MNTAINSVFDELKYDEGLRLKMYKDSQGIWTIGYGHNLEAKGISQAAAEQILRDDLIEAAEAVATHLPWSKQLNTQRQAVLIDMAFNMGIQGLLGFKTTLRLIEAGDYDEAANQMLLSKWAGQVGDRAHRLSMQMRSGEWPTVSG